MKVWLLVALAVLTVGCAKTQIAQLGPVSVSGAVTWEEVTIEAKADTGSIIAPLCRLIPFDVPFCPDPVSPI